MHIKFSIWVNWLAGAVRVVATAAVMLEQAPNSAHSLCRRASSYRKATTHTDCRPIISSSNRSAIAPHTLNVHSHLNSMPKNWRYTMPCSSSSSRDNAHNANAVHKTCSFIFFVIIILFWRWKAVAAAVAVRLRLRLPRCRCALVWMGFFFGMTLISYQPHIQHRAAHIST